MLTLISFYYKPDFFYQHKDSINAIEQSIRKNIDYLLINGWRQEDIYIKTNFEFSYKNINSISFDYTQCSNLFLTKIIAAHEILNKYPENILWQHDHDTYQLRLFNQEQLNKQLTHDINMCNYWMGNNRPQGASVFYKGLSRTLIDMYNHIITTNINLCDEKFFMYFMQKFGGSINLKMPYEYNTSLTKFTHDKRFSVYPYCVHGDLRSRFARRLFEHYVSQKNI